MTHSVHPKFKHLFLFGAFLFCLFEWIKAQSNTPSEQIARDTAQASHWMNIGKSFENAGQYDSVLLYYQKATTLYEKHTMVADDTSYWDAYLRYNNQLGDLYRRLGEFDKGLTLLKRALEEGKIYLGNNHRRISDSYNNIGIIYAVQGELEQAIYNFQEALSIRIVSLGEKHPLVADSYNNIGIVNRRHGNYDKALEYFQKALTIRLATQGEMHLHTANHYANIGIILKDQGAYEKALANFQKVLKIRLSILEEKHPTIGHTYQNLGTVFTELGAFQEALESLQKALSIQVAALGGEHPSIAIIYQSIGVVYNRQGLYEKALTNFQKALSIHIATLGEKHPSVASHYHNIGVIYNNQGRYDEALTNYQKALSIQLGSLGEKHPELAYSYQNIGEAHVNLRSYHKALQNYQKSLQANLPDFDANEINRNPTVSDVALSKARLLKSLFFKANTLYRLFQYESHQLQDIILADDTYKLAVQWIDKMRGEYDRKRDKGELLKKAFEVYEGAIQTSFELYHQTKQDSFLQQAFTYFEKSRSILLLEALKKSQAKAFAGIPDTLLEKENELASLLAFYEEKLFKEQLKQDKADSVYISLLEGKVFDLKQSSDSINGFFENQYPDYYRLKYDVSVPSIADVQSNLVDEQTALLEYFIGDSSMYVYVITKGTYDLLEIPKDFLLEDQVRLLQHSMYTYHISGSQSDELYSAYADTFATTAHQLYQKIIAPILQAYDLPEKLIIIPDGVLGYLPFEVLLTELPEHPAQFSSHNYLVKSSQISYSYSAALLQELKEKQNQDQAKDRLLAFAPSFEEVSLMPMVTRSIENIRENMGALKFNIPEVSAIHELLGGDMFIGTSATEEQFTQLASKYQILHLATHAKSNDEVGDYSFLAFADIQDSLENEILYTLDLYNLQLNADMVVLSACETGLGELQRGEGIVSLARGFFYAGAKSIVSTLWSVNDAATMELMQSFYTYLKAGQSKDFSLRQAKLDFLQSHSHVEAHPFFWGAMVAVGDMEPIDLRNSFPWWWVLLAIAMGSLVLYLFRSRRFKKV